MKYFASRLLPTLALALALFGCGSVERQPEPGLSGTVPVTASTGTASPAGPSAEPSPPPDLQSAASRLKLNLHIFGISYHPDRAGTRFSHLDNELNFGLGLNYEYHNTAQGVANVEIGFYKDSGSNWAKFAGTGYQFKLDDHWLFGGDLLLLQSPTYNLGRAFVAPVPRLTYDFGTVKVNGVYVPKYAPYNEFAVFAIYFTVHLGKW